MCWSKQSFWIFSPYSPNFQVQGAVSIHLSLRICGWPKHDECPKVTFLYYWYACPPHISFVSSFGISTLPSLVAQFIIFSQAFSRWRALPGPSLPSQMEHKRDADAAGLTWLLTHLHRRYLWTHRHKGILWLLPLWDLLRPGTIHWRIPECIQQELTLRLRSQHPKIVILLLLTKVDLASDWSTRFISRSLPTPTTRKNCSSWRYRQQEFQGPEIPNIFSMPCLDNGSGPNILPTTGATTLACLCDMEPTHLRITSHRTWNLPSPRHRGRPLLSLPQSCRSFYQHLRYLGNVRTNWAWCSEWPFLRLSKSSRRHRARPSRISIDGQQHFLLSCLLRFLYYRSAIAASSEKRNPASAGCVCVTHLYRCKTSVSCHYIYMQGAWQLFP